MSETITRILGGGGGLTAASTYISKPLDADSVSHLDVRVFCSGSHPDDDADTLMAADLVGLSAHLYNPNTW